MSINLELKYPELNRNQITKIASMSEDERIRHIDLTIANIIAGNIRKGLRNQCGRKTFSSRLREEIMIRDRLTCQNCGWENGKKGVKDKVMHLDHIIPISKGGTNKIDNIQLLCANCNLKKSDKI